MWKLVVFAGVAYLSYHQYKQIKSLRRALREKSCSEGEQSSSRTSRQCSLSKQQISRYSRQLILPEIGVDGQNKLLKSRVLVVGTGGLASTLVPMLAAAGVGTIGLVDNDFVDESNLHRQIMFSEVAVGTSRKVDVMKAVIARLNSSTHVKTYPVRFMEDNALEIIESFDVVVDATDNLATRYVINDACAFSKKPLVSGAAQGVQGQLTVFTPGEGDGPLGSGGCYRCIYPEPPDREHQGSCEDDGVLGPVPGIMGSFLGLEAIKVLVSLAGMGALTPLVSHTMLVDFRNLHHGFMFVKKNDRLREKCLVCRESPVIRSMRDTTSFLQKHGLSTANGSCIRPVVNVGRFGQVVVEDWSPVKYNEARKEDVLKSHLLLDVRNPTQFKICSLNQSVNLPIVKLKSENGESVLTKLVNEQYSSTSPEDTPRIVVVYCRRGIYSKEACDIISKMSFDPSMHLKVINLRNGLEGWKSLVDRDFPSY